MSWWSDREPFNEYDPEWCKYCDGGGSKEECDRCCERHMRGEVMSDLIKREDAIAEICKARTDVVSYHYAELFINAVRRAPSADRPQGFWTKVDVATYRCSECGKKQIADDVNELNYCCCCGSQNKVRYKVQMLKGADDE